MRPVTWGEIIDAGLMLAHFLIPVAPLAVFLLLLTGCAHERVVIETVEVKVPVVTACAVALPADPDRPTMKPLTAGTPHDQVYEAMQRALAEIELWEGWAVRARAAVSACLKGGKP